MAPGIANRCVPAHCRWVHGSGEHRPAGLLAARVRFDAWPWAGPRRGLHSEQDERRESERVEHVAHLGGSPPATGGSRTAGHFENSSKNLGPGCGPGQGHKFVSASKSQSGPAGARRWLARRGMPRPPDSSGRHRQPDRQSRSRTNSIPRGPGRVGRDGRAPTSPCPNRGATASPSPSRRRRRSFRRGTARRARKSRSGCRAWRTRGLRPAR